VSLFIEQKLDQNGKAKAIFQLYWKKINKRSLFETVAKLTKNKVLSPEVFKQ